MKTYDEQQLYTQPFDWVQAPQPLPEDALGVVERCKHATRMFLRRGLPTPVEHLLKDLLVRHYKNPLNVTGNLVVSGLRVCSRRARPGERRWVQLQLYRLVEEAAATLPALSPWAEDDREAKLILAKQEHRGRGLDHGLERLDRDRSFVWLTARNTTRTETQRREGQRIRLFERMCELQYRLDDLHLLVTAGREWTKEITFD